MTTVDQRQPSTHLVSKLKDPIYRTPQGKIVIAIGSACPALRPFMGVMLQYLIQMNLSIRCEGAQALSRYKAYKAQLLEVIASGQLPTRKFRHALPIYRLALRFREDNFILSCLHTVCRSYDLYLPDDTMCQKALESFNESFMTDSAAQIDHSKCVKLQDEVFDFREEITDLSVTPEFIELSSKIRFDRTYSPEEKAILLTKKGTAKFSSHPAPIKGFAPAIVGSTSELIEAINCRMSDGLSYYDKLTQLGNLIGERSFPSMKVTFQEPPEGALSSMLRRNVVIPSPGFKSRVIAVGDYNTQYMLSPIHRWAFECLRQISSDYTFNHERGFQRLNEFTRSRPFVACFDLSNATDAFPVSFTEEVLRVVLPGGNDIAPLWVDIMTSLPFGKRYYRRGQPMGLLSSWAAFALSHHFVVWLAAKKAGGTLLRRVLANPSEYYGIVGDDVFITHPALAHYYAIIIVALGVKINFTKSLIVTSDKRVSEFVKRNSFRGMEITALSPGLIVKSFNDYACLRELILRLRSIRSNGSDLSLYDEVTLSETIRSFAGGFIHRAMSILSTVPVVYAGVAPMERRGVWPPQARFYFLALKVWEILNLRLRGIYIGSDGQDCFNDLVRWLTQEITLEGTFHRTQFYEFMKKQIHTTDFEINGPSGIRNRLIAKLSVMARSLSERYISEEEFASFEDEFLADLEHYVPEQTMSVKAVNRAMTRSYAHKLFKAVQAFPTSPFETLASIEQKIYLLHERFSFKLPVSNITEYSPFGEIER